MEDKWRNHRVGSYSVSPFGSYSVSPVIFKLNILRASSNNKTKCSLARKAKGYNGMTLHVMEQPPRFFALT
jgi:hypothetical protein